MPIKKEIDTKIYESKDKIKARIIADCAAIIEQLDECESWCDTRNIPNGGFAPKVPFLTDFRCRFQTLGANDDFCRG